MYTSTVSERGGKRFDTPVAEAHHSSEKSEARSEHPQQHEGEKAKETEKTGEHERAWADQVSDPKTFAEPDHAAGRFTHFKRTMKGGNNAGEYRRKRVKQLHESIVPVAVG